MGSADSSSSLAPPSALQSLLASHPLPKDSPHSADYHNLALQIAHNLRYQHSWTALRLHTTAARPPAPLPRPLVSGIPPRRLYVHPDEQIALLQEHKDRGLPGAPTLAAEREWVLPSHLREKWSLRRFGEAFDAIGIAPEGVDGEALFEEGRQDEEGEGEHEGGTEVGEWRRKSPKRLLLATLDDDSTVVYYIVHDGVVKPRQN